MISAKEFAILYNTVASRFQAMNNIALTAKCYQYVEDLPLEGVREICDDFFDNARHVPLPGDFKKATKEWKKNFFMKNGYWYGKSDIVAEYTKLDCEYCTDVGVVRMVSIGGDHEKLIRCSCAKGENSSEKMPVWSNDLRAGFKREPCLIDWFKPDIESNEKDEKMYTKLLDKFVAWKKRLNLAEQHWQSLGYVKND